MSSRTISHSIVGVALLFLSLVAMGDEPEGKDAPADSGVLQALKVRILDCGLTDGQYYISCEASNPNQDPLMFVGYRMMHSILPLPKVQSRRSTVLNFSARGSGQSIPLAGVERAWTGSNSRQASQSNLVS